MQRGQTEGLGEEQQYGALREIDVSAAPAADIVESQRRFRRNTYVVIALLLVGGMVWSGRRMALGVALGGTLSIFNEHWLRSSVGAILGTVAGSRDKRVPRWTATKFILRYFVIALAAGLAVRSGYFNLLGIGLGLASFVGAVMLEAGYQVYLTFNHR